MQPPTLSLQRQSNKFIHGRFDESEDDGVMMADGPSHLELVKLSLKIEGIE